VEGEKISIKALRNRPLQRLLYIEVRFCQKEEQNGELGLVALIELLINNER